MNMRITWRFSSGGAFERSHLKWLVKTNKELRVQHWVVGHTLILLAYSETSTLSTRRACNEAVHSFSCPPFFLHTVISSPSKRKLRQWTEFQRCSIMTTHNFNFLSYQAEAEFSNQTLQTMIAKTERKKLIEEINIDHRQKYWRKIVVHLVTKDEHALWLIVHSSSQAFFFFFLFYPVRCLELVVGIVRGCFSLWFLHWTIGRASDNRKLLLLRATSKPEMEKTEP